ncbi:hypothetical protein [Pseudomonas sp. CGJS7]|uniref:hypothetical protein n=1 Tax=Pseudomonas sp. CGJS7 TaxID=3109348 RepID=UPI0030098E7B
MRQAPTPAVWLACAAMLSLTSVAQAASLRGSVGGEARVYADAPALADQDRERTQGSAYVSLNASGQTEGGARLDLDLFGRLAPRGSHEARGDVRQATVRWDSGKTEWKLGVLAETWGVLEAWNPVDIINQRDLAEDFQGDVKLGQPGAVANLQLENTLLSFYATTYARGRRYGEGEDRLRALPAPILEETFERGRWAPGLAMRAKFRLGSLDLALSQYAGPAREPVLQPLLGGEGLRGFRAVYERIGQTGLEAQYVAGDSVFKAEVIRQQGGTDDFWGGGIGMETGFSKFAGGAGDLALYAEYYADTRNAAAPLTPFQRDVFLGARYTCNDAHDTVLELRSTYDLQRHSNLLDVRAQRRVLGDAVLSLSLIKAFDAQRDQALRGFERDTHLKIGFAWYF